MLTRFLVLDFRHRRVGEDRADERVRAPCRVANHLHINEKIDSKKNFF